MVDEIEISTLDLRYQDFRMKNARFERQLSASISERGIEEPLEGVDTRGARVLLNGFKRYRCARKLHIGVVPYASLGDDEAAGIMDLLRVPKRQGLALLEQALFIEELHSSYGLSVAEVAAQLGRSKAWVSMRLGLMGEMSDTVRAEDLQRCVSASTRTCIRCGSSCA